MPKLSQPYTYSFIFQYLDNTSGERPFAPTSLISFVFEVTHPEQKEQIKTICESPYWGLILASASNANGLRLILQELLEDIIEKVGVQGIPIGSDNVAVITSRCKLH